VKWAKQSEHVAFSDSKPVYKVARFMDGNKANYRASVRGEFIGKVCDDPKEAQAICERHLMIMGEEKEVA
jgi:hypothetical protein